MLRLHYKRIMAAGAFLGLLVVAAALAAAGVRSAGSAVNGAASARGGGPLASSHLPCSHGGKALRFYSSRAHRRRHGMSSDMHGVLLDLWDDAWHQGRLIFEPTAISIQASQREEATQLIIVPIMPVTVTVTVAALSGGDGTAAAANRGSSTPAAA